jgi:ribosomal protein L11 methyltransferase
MMHQATIQASARPAERIARALEEAIDPSPTAVGIFDRGQGHFEVFAHYEAEPRHDVLLALIAKAADGEVTGPLSITDIAPEDWVTLSQAKRGPVKAGRFFVHGSHDRDRAPGHRFTIEIDSGRAFGTAHHASTRGCLLALDALLKHKRPRIILDVGTGSGVLAIAAANALKRNVLATDNDPVAAGVARDNTRLNCARRLVSVFAANGFAHPVLRRLDVDLLLANLLERAHHAFAPCFARHVAPKGTAVLSGITEVQARSIEARMRAHGFAMEKRFILDGWTTLVMVRRRPRALRD